MKRLAAASALLIALSGLGVAAASSAHAGIPLADLSLTHSPPTMTVGDVGTVTMTLTNNQGGSETIDYDLIDTLPSQFTIGQVTDAGPFEGCEVDNTQHTVSCDASIDIAVGASVSVTFQVTPVESGTFDNTAQYTYFIPATVNETKAHRSGLKPAGANPIGGTAHDSIAVKAAVTSTPTPTPTPTPTHTPTHKPTHKPTHTPRPIPPASVEPTTATLPNTGSSDLGVLALVGMALIVVGGVITAALRSRRSGNYTAK